MNKSKWIYVILTVLLIVVALGFFYTNGSANNMIKYFLAKNNDSTADKPEPGIGRWIEPINILVVGIDNDSYVSHTPEPGPWRADVIILVQVDADRKQVNLLSIPRDTRTYIPGHGTEKIAHAHAYGDMPLTVAAVGELMEVRIDHYIRLDYLTFTRVVDIMGGIEIDVPREVTTNNNVYFQAGRQLMTGRQAYEYIHSRDEPEGDIARINRQQLFLRALLETVCTQTGGLDLARIYLEFIKGSEVSLSLGEIIQLASLARDLKADDITMRTLPGKVGCIDGISYWLVYDDGLQAIRQR